MSEQISDDTWLILLNWNGLSHLQYCIPSLFASAIGNAHVLVVDNGSKDKSCEFLHSNFGGRVELLSLTANLGWAGGNNAGIRYAAENGAKLVVLLNNDMKFSKDWLKGILSCFATYSDAGVVGAKICNDQQTFEKYSASGLASDVSPSSHIDGCCMGTRIDLMRLVGLFDEEFFIYREESDYQERVKKAGFRIMEAGAPVWHCDEGTMVGFPERKSYLSMRNTMIFYRRHRAPHMFFVMLIHIILCALLPNYRTHSIENRRFHASYPIKNLWLFVRALWWNIKDMLKRGYRANGALPELC